MVTGTFVKSYKRKIHFISCNRKKSCLPKDAFTVMPSTIKHYRKRKNLFVNCMDLKVNPVLLPGKSHGRRSLVGCSPWGREESENWVTSLSLFTFLHWRRKWQPTPVFLPGESQEWRSLWVAVYGVTQSWTRLKQLSSSSKVNHNVFN